MFSIRKEFTFEAAHQLEDAVTKECYECVHGHSYKVELVVGCTFLDKNDMVVDFAELKDFKTQIMECWDHGVLFHESKLPLIQPLIDAGVWKQSKVNFLNDNPTAETMAKLLNSWLQIHLLKKPYENIRADRIRRGVHVKSVRVHETNSGWAEYET